MILSASGWRKVFAVSGDEQDHNPQISEEDWALSAACASVFFDYLSQKTGQECPVIALGRDTRPTGTAIVSAMKHILVKKGAVVQNTGYCSAPEIMAYAKKLDGFIYVSASHNPIGHNGIKFGINDGGVLNATENAKLVEALLAITDDDAKMQALVKDAQSCSSSALHEIELNEKSSKHNALRAYEDFICQTVTDSENKEHQKDFFEMLDAQIRSKGFGVVCDFNGSSRAYCIDKEFFTTHGIDFYSLNEETIAHEIIPEAENLVYVAEGMEDLHRHNKNCNAFLGYMPDCDGDRGNIVYWDQKEGKPVILKAQEVFSLSVLAELTYSIWKNGSDPSFKPAVCVNCPTSMRIDEICRVLGAQVFRAEVGEANVVNLAREKREEGWNVRILGEGSNGGTITHPASVRDPLNTVFAIIKLLMMREDGLYEIWCKKAGIEYKADFTLTDVLESLPVYTTTGVSEPRAILKVKNTNHAALKAAFQKVFESEWEKKKADLKKQYGIASYEAVITNGTKETRDVSDYSLSGKGGLKIIFKDDAGSPVAFIWMRGSGTEPVFRIMCDVKGDNAEEEKALLEWETELIKKADV
ncbi:MAG: phosphoglucomutase [Treponema sp.]|nr:phosphoglucomutase [Treponema sp.]